MKESDSRTVLLATFIPKAFDTSLHRKYTLSIVLSLPRVSISYTFPSLSLNFSLSFKTNISGAISSSSFKSFSLKYGIFLLHHLTEIKGKARDGIFVFLL